MGGAGSLCWKKFAPVVRANLEDVERQRAISDFTPAASCKWISDPVALQPDARPSTDPPQFPMLNPGDFDLRFFARTKNDRWLVMPRAAVGGKTVWAAFLRLQDVGEVAVVVRCGGFTSTMLPKIRADRPDPMCIFIETRASLLRSARVVLPPQILDVPIRTPFELTNPRHSAGSPTRIEWDATTQTARGRLVLTIREDGRAELFADLRERATTQPAPP